MFTWIKNFFRNRVFITEYYFNDVEGFRPAFGFYINKETTFFMKATSVTKILSLTTFLVTSGLILGFKNRKTTGKFSIREPISKIAKNIWQDFKSSPIRYTLKFGVNFGSLFLQYNVNSLISKLPLTIGKKFGIFCLSQTGIRFGTSILTNRIHISPRDLTVRQKQLLAKKLLSKLSHLSEAEKAMLIQALHNSGGETADQVLDSFLDCIEKTTGVYEVINDRLRDKIFNLFGISAVRACMFITPEILPLIEVAFLESDLVPLIQDNSVVKDLAQFVKLDTTYKAVTRWSTQQALEYRVVNEVGGGITVFLGLAIATTVAPIWGITLATIGGIFALGTEYTVISMRAHNEKMKEAVCARHFFAQKQFTPSKFPSIKINQCHANEFPSGRIFVGGWSDVQFYKEASGSELIVAGNEGVQIATMSSASEVPVETGKAEPMTKLGNSVQLTSQLLLDDDVAGELYSLIERIENRDFTPISEPDPNLPVVDIAREKRLAIIKHQSSKYDFSKMICQKEEIEFAANSYCPRYVEPLDPRKYRFIDEIIKDIDKEMVSLTQAPDIIKDPATNKVYVKVDCTEKTFDDLIYPTEGQYAGEERLELNVQRKPKDSLLRYRQRVIKDRIEICMENNKKID